MRLFYHPNSSASLRVVLAIRCKRLPPGVVELVVLAKDEFTFRLPDGDPEARRLGTTDYTAFSPEGRVPVLMAGGVQITQSLAIIEYLEAETAKYPDVLPLLPSASLSRVRVSQIANLVQCDIHPLQNLPLVKKAVDFGMNADGFGRDLRAHPFRLHFLRRGLGALDQLLAETAGRYSVGDAVTVADVYLVPQVRNALGAGIDVATEFPRVHQV